LSSKEGIFIFVNVATFG